MEVLLVLGVALPVIALVRLVPPRGAAVSRQWGGGRDPSPDQVALVARHLRDRRTLAVVFIAVGLAVVLAWSRGGRYEAIAGSGLFVVLGSLLAALLLAEWAATLRRLRGTVRSATLHRRSRHELVPTYAVVLQAVMTGLAVTVGVALVVTPGWAQGRLGEPPPAEPSGPRFMSEYATPDLYRDLAAMSASTGWLLIAAAVGAAAVAFGVVRLAVVRPTAATVDWVDGALRMRSARVSTGIGIAFAAQVVGGGLTELPLQLMTASEVLPPAVGGLATIASGAAFSMFPLGIAAWSWVASPPHRRDRVGAT